MSLSSRSEYYNKIKNALDNPELVKQELALISPDDRKELFTKQDKLNNVLLHKAAQFPAAFKMLMELDVDLNIKIDALLIVNNIGMSPLCVAADNTESFNIAMGIIPPERHREIVQREVEPGTRSRLLKFSGNQEVDSKILGIYPPKERICAVIEKPKYGSSAIDSACVSPERLFAMLNMLPITDWPDAILNINKVRVHDLLRNLVMCNNPESIQQMLAIISLFPLDSRFRIIPIAELLTCSPETVIAVMNLLSTTDKERGRDVFVSDRVWMLKNSYDINSRTASYEFLICYAYRNMNGAIQILEALENDDERVKAIELCRGKFIPETVTLKTTDMTAFQKVAKMYPPQQRLAVFGEVAERLAGLPKLMAGALAVLRPEDRLTALKTAIPDTTYSGGMLYKKTVMLYRKFDLIALINFIPMLPLADIHEMLAFTFRNRTEDAGFIDYANTTIRAAIANRSDIRDQFVRGLKEVHQLQDARNAATFFWCCRKHNLYPCGRLDNQSIMYIVDILCEEKAAEVEKIRKVVTP